MGARRAPSRYANSRREQQGHWASRAGALSWRISPDHTSIVVSFVSTGSAPEARILIASPEASAAMDAVTAASTPSVSHVACAPEGGSAYTQRRQAVRPGTIGIFKP